MNIAHAVEKVLVDLHECEGTKFAVVDLHGENHYDLFQNFKKLPDVLECNGTLYGKSGWDSDRCKAYYRSDKTFASASKV